MLHNILPYVEHWLLECLGSAIGVYAYRFCKHKHHQWMVWIILSILGTVVTVKLIG
jgi:hypothetical protein